MKTYKHLYEESVKIENITGDIVTAAKHKHKRKDVQKVMNNIDEHAEIVRQMLLDHSFTPSARDGHAIKDGAKDKIRIVGKPKFCYDQIMAHVIVRQVKPIVLKSMYYHVYGSIEGKGQTQVKNTIEKWIRNDPKGTKYIGQGDARQYYHSIDQDILSRMLHEKIKDEEFMLEANKFVYQLPRGLDDSTECLDNGGIVLGDPTSVWFGHFYFGDMDHFASQQDGVDHYLRLADDWIITGSNKKKLHRAMDAIRTYMYEKLHLRLKFNYQVFRMDWVDKDGNHHGRFLDIDGYRFYRDRTTLRKSNLLHATRKARRIGEKNCPTIQDARQMMSHLARLKTCDAYNVYEGYVKDNVNPKQLRKIISAHDRKERIYEVENGRRIPGGETERN